MATSREEEEVSVITKDALILTSIFLPSLSLIADAEPRASGSQFNRLAVFRSVFLKLLTEISKFESCKYDITNFDTKITWGI